MPERISSKPRGGGRTDRPTSVFLDTTGNPTLGIGICQRCNFKFPLHMLQDDPNIPGMKVCAADRDDFDPYRMPARAPDKITLPFVRPDVPLNEGPAPPAAPITPIPPIDLNVYLLSEDGLNLLTEDGTPIIISTGIAELLLSEGGIGLLTEDGVSLITEDSL